MTALQVTTEGILPQTAEDEIHEARLALQELAQADAPLVFVFDQDTRRHLYLTGPSEKLFSLTLAEIRADPDSWQKRLQSEDKAAFTTLRRDLALHGHITRILRVKHPNGQLRTLRATAIARTIHGRKLVAGSVVEITPGTYTPEESELHRLAIESTHEGVAVTDATGTYLFLNREHIKLFGYERAEELIGRSWRLLYPETSIKEIENSVFPHLAAHGVWRGRLRAVRKDGTLFHEELTLSLMPNGGLICSCRDATEQVDMAARLEASETMFRTFLNNLDVGVTIRNLIGHYEFVNQATLDFLGKESGGSSAPSGLERCLSKNSVFASWAVADQGVASNGQASQFDFPIHWGGRDWVLNVRKLPLCIASDAITHVCTLISDVTEQRRMEKEESENRAQRETYHLMQREFISMVSHEFRTPLTSIKGVHYLLASKSRQLPPENAADWARLLTMQGSAIATLVELVDQVLLLNRIEHMSQEMPTQPVALAEFIRQITERITRSLEVSDASDQKRLLLELNITEDFFTIVDEQQMRAAVENLVSNALKYSPESGKVHICVRTRADFWELKVMDRGRGIPPHDMKKLFQPFHRASNVGQVPGTGLGLTIIKRVTDYHRGHVEVESELGRGTTFTLRIPRVPKTESVNGSKIHTVHPFISTQRIIS